MRFWKGRAAERRWCDNKRQAHGKNKWKMGGKEWNECSGTRRDGGTGKRDEPERSEEWEERRWWGRRGGGVEEEEKMRDETNHLEHETKGKKKNFCASSTSYLATEDCSWMCVCACCTLYTPDTTRIIKDNDDNVYYLKCQTGPKLFILSDNKF